MEQINLAVGDTLCYIQPCAVGHRLLLCPIQSIRGKKVRVRNFGRAWDTDEIASNTQWLERAPGIMAVQEPFVATEAMLIRAQKFCAGAG